MADAFPNSANTEDWDLLLQEKDDLIEALTSQLEQTVEQLDRLKRMGADKGGSVSRGGGGGSMSLELIDRLDAMLSQWEETQPHELLLAIDQKLADGGGIPAVLTRPEDPRVSERPMEKPKGRSVETLVAASPKAEKPAEEEDFWAAAKARLMGLSDSSDQDGESSPSDTQTQSDEPRKERENPHLPEASGKHVLDEEDDLDGPAPVERSLGLSGILEFPRQPPEDVPDDASLEKWQEAVVERDDYIRYLTGKVRELHEQNQHRIPWGDIQTDAKKLRNAMEVVSQALVDRLKEGEIALEMERKELSRERVKLFQIKADLERQIMKLGQQQAASARTPAPSRVANEEPSEKPKPDLQSRWNRFLTKEQK
ncbi:MAG: hypothetical protein KDA80_06690 [Planctomycetaceae bacterium]|nr:hypothetical protein [Planctomycetaceae bacterium]